MGCPGVEDHHLFARVDVACLHRRGQGAHAGRALGAEGDALQLHDLAHPVGKAIFGGSDGAATGVADSLEDQEVAQSPGHPDSGCQRVRLVEVG